MTDDLFIESTRSSGDWAGVFEYDGEVGYFYLYKLSGGGDGGKIAGAIEIVNGRLTFDSDEVEIKWSVEQDRVGLFVESKLWALFNVKSGTSFGQIYSTAMAANVPKDQLFS